MSNFASMSRDGLPTLALSAGEPAGIGPDIVASTATRDISARIVCFASPVVIGERARALGIDLKIDEFGSAADVPPHRAGTLAVVPVATATGVIAGKLDERNAAYVLACLDAAIAAARHGEVDCIVTGPVHKGAINNAGFPFTGHTEYLAAAFKPAPRPVMMLASDKLRVALVTTHMPLRQVADAIDTGIVLHVIATVSQAMEQDFGVDAPRIAVCGLNPHAGEGGHLGNEDLAIITPAIATARARGIDVIGPIPADTAFAPSMRDSIDAYISMYHDQGLPVIKALAFGEIVNITLGLPVRRTSVDHGTALELAASGKAKDASLLAAIEQALRLSCRDAL
jgi:4-hydroxythreonine-4-phosphate dehydrogenase